MRLYWFFIVALLWDITAGIRLRLKRQNFISPGRSNSLNRGESSDPNAIIQLPGNYRPIGTPAGVINPLLPLYPFNNNFGIGLRVNPQSKSLFDGNLGFPVINPHTNEIYPFDLDGGFLTGDDDVVFDFGTALSPVNPLQIPLQQIYSCLAQGGCGNQLSNLAPVNVPFQTPRTRIPEATIIPDRSVQQNSNPPQQQRQPQPQPQSTSPNFGSSPQSSITSFLSRLPPGQRAQLISTFQNLPPDQQQALINRYFGNGDGGRVPGRIDLDSFGLSGTREVEPTPQSDRVKSDSSTKGDFRGREQNQVQDAFERLKGSKKPENPFYRPEVFRRFRQGSVVRPTLDNVYYAQQLAGSSSLNKLSLPVLNGGSDWEEEYVPPYFIRNRR